MSSPRVFFVHVMKTGGMTLFWHLRANFEPDEIYPYGELDMKHDGPRLDFRYHLSIPALLTLPPERQSRIRVYTGHWPYVASELLSGDLETMTVLRDPIERTISLLRQFRRNAPWMPASRRPPLAEAPLEEVYEDERIFEPLVHNHQTKIFSMTPDDDPVDYMQVIDVDASRLAVAKGNLAGVNVVGLQECFGDFLERVIEHFGWQAGKSKRVNETPSDGDGAVSGTFRRRIAEDNAIDLEFYEYARELVHERR